MTHNSLIYPPPSLHLVNWTGWEKLIWANFLQNIFHFPISSFQSTVNGCYTESSFHWCLKKMMLDVSGWCSERRDTFPPFSYSYEVLQHLQPLVCDYHFSAHPQSPKASLLPLMGHWPFSATREGPLWIFTKSYRQRRSFIKQSILTWNTVGSITITIYWITFLTKGVNLSSKITVPTNFTIVSLLQDPFSTMIY